MSAARVLCVRVVFCACSVLVLYVHVGRGRRTYCVWVYVRALCECCGCVLSECSMRTLYVRVLYGICTCMLFVRVLYVSTVYNRYV